MTLLIVTPNLTKTEIDHKAARTHEGMAHFAGEGPINHTCRMCEHWQVNRKQPERQRGNHLLKPCQCAKYTERNNGKSGPKVPYDASACKFFELNKQAPGILP